MCVMPARTPRPPSRRTICCTTATRSSPAASARTTTACRCSSAKPTDWPWCEAATSGDPHFFLGTDSAPHATHLKEHAAGCAGCYTAFAAIELYAEAFDSVGALDRLEGFASQHGPDFYRLPRNRDRITLQRQAWQMPAATSPFGRRHADPLRAGQTLPWKLQTTPGLGRAARLQGRGGCSQHCLATHPGCRLLVRPRVPRRSGRNR
jgi:hypothetical protein